MFTSGELFISLITNKNFIGKRGNLFLEAVK